MLKYFLIFFILFSYLFALDVDNNRTFDNILPHAQIYIDKTNVLTLEEVKKQNFTDITQNHLAFGYSPDFNVWIKFRLENNSNKRIIKVLEYANPLTTNVIFFEPQSNIILQEGLIHKGANNNSINPAFTVLLEPHSSKTFYIKAHSYKTTLIVKLYLWNPKSFQKKELKHQFILAMFFGAMGIIIAYNLLIYLGTKEVSYLYYVLFFISISIHQLLYRGLAGVYVLSPQEVETTVEFSSFFVALPAIFLALFTQNILELKQYPRINKLLNYYLLLFPLLLFFTYYMELYRYKNIFAMILSIFLFFIIVYVAWKRNRQAYFLVVGWSFSIISGILLYLSSIGFFVSNLFPYYAEFALVVESLIFSLLLADRIKQLNKEKIALQADLINHQKEEQKKLTNMVKIKTQELQQSLNQQELLLKEFNHRLKNNIQTIVSFLRLQVDEIEEPRIQNILIDLENRIMSISHLYTLLYNQNSVSSINTYEYFTLLIDDIERSYDMPNININVKTEVNISSEYAVYCGFILNEAITNAFKHAFPTKKKGSILINLIKNNNLYKLSICDNGIGYEQSDNKDSKDSLGLIIIDTLVRTQLQGELIIHSNNGVKMEIEWREDD